MTTRVPNWRAVEEMEEAEQFRWWPEWIELAG